MLSYLVLYAGFTSEMVYILEHAHMREDMMELFAYACTMSV